MAMVAEKRFAVIDDEKTALFVVGMYQGDEDDGTEKQLIIALSFRDEHVVAWHSFAPLNLDGVPKILRAAGSRESTGPCEQLLCQAGETSFGTSRKGTSSWFRIW
jgi:hypothetical protein